MDIALLIGGKNHQLNIHFKVKFVKNNLKNNNQYRSIK